MEWKKCNYRHALKSYDYVARGPSNQNWPWGYDTDTELILYLRKTYGDEVTDTGIKDCRGMPVWSLNPHWFLDKPRNRIWIKSETLMMIHLRGIS